MNKKLAEIFHRDSFQVGDKVEVRDKRQCEVLKIVDNQLLLLENSGTFWWFDYVTNLKIPNVTKDDVEMALINNGFVYWTELTVLTLKHAEEKIKFTVRTGIEKADTFYWQLGKGLWKQSESTQKSIEAILKPKET